MNNGKLTDLVFTLEAFTKDGSFDDDEIKALTTAERLVWQAIKENDYSIAELKKVIEDTHCLNPKQKK